MTPKQQLDKFLNRFTPEIAARARAAHAKMRKLTPGAIEMVYDNYNFLVIGFCPNERPSDGIFSIALHARGVGLCFLQGAKLPDPDKLLKGAGNVVRSIRLNDAKVLDDPAVRRLIKTALARAKVPLNPNQRRQLIIKSISAKQRPRRPAT